MPPVNESVVLKMDVVLQDTGNKGAAKYIPEDQSGYFRGAISSKKGSDGQVMLIDE